MNYFPVALAGGRAFCNRTYELERLHYNFKQGNHTLLLSPRRYGKTSLAIRACQMAKLPFVHIDLYKALSVEEIVKLIVSGVGRLLGQIETKPEKLMAGVKEVFGGFQVTFSVEKFGLSVELGRHDKNSSDMLLEALERLDTYATKRKKKVVLYLDEFQMLGEVAKNNQIEAVLREAAQKSHSVRYLFSGSSRHLIEAMFNDKKRPFYNICDTIILDRVSETHYLAHLQKAAKHRWRLAIATEAAKHILHITERHAYYVNKLCSLLWQQTSPPEQKDINAMWQQFVEESRSGIERELSLLSLNQRRVLLNIARADGVREPFSQVHAVACGMSSTSIHRATDTLLEKDYVLIDADKTYRVLDPLIKAVLASDAEI